jgi:hypothetical protein
VPYICFLCPPCKTTILIVFAKELGSNTIEIDFNARTVTYADIAIDTFVYLYRIGIFVQTERAHWAEPDTGTTMVTKAILDDL